MISQLRPLQKILQLPDCKKGFHSEPTCFSCKKKASNYALMSGDKGSGGRIDQDEILGLTF